MQHSQRKCSVRALPAALWLTMGDPESKPKPLPAAARAGGLTCLVSCNAVSVGATSMTQCHSPIALDRQWAWCPLLVTHKQHAAAKAASGHSLAVPEAMQVQPATQGRHLRLASLRAAGVPPAAHHLGTQLVWASQRWLTCLSPPMLQVFLTPHHLAIVMECANGGTMRDYLLKQPNHRLPEVLGRWIFQQMIIGLDYCHARVRPAGSLSGQASSPCLQATPRVSGIAIHPRRLPSSSTPKVECSGDQARPLLGEMAAAAACIAAVLRTAAASCPRPWAARCLCSGLWQCITATFLGSCSL